MGNNVGRIARINLTSGKVEVQNSQDYYKWLGGRGFGVKTIFDEVKKETAPLSPDNILVMATGCFTGTALPGSSRINIVTKNVFNNGISYSSGGGDFAPALKYAGFDALIIEGRSDKPVYLYAHDGSIEIKEAAGIWGKTTWDTEDEIRTQLKDESVRIAAIGPAGENLVKIACVIIDKAHAAAWGGCGAVMGSKNLKAVVAKESSDFKINMADPKKYHEECERYKWILKSSMPAANLKRAGTHGTAGAGGLTGKAPTSVRNSLDEYWDPEKNEKVREIAYKKYEKKRTGCFNCPISCLHWYEMEYKGELIEAEGMHANSVRGFSSNWDVDDPMAVFKAHTLCNKYGMDVDGTSSTIAWAIECFENGVIDTKDTFGMELKWGNADEFIKLMEDIAYRQRFGNILAEGVYKASQIIGRNSMEHAMQVKGVGINEQSLRTHKAWSLSIAVSSRGSGHVSGAPQTEKRGIPAEICEWLFDCPEAGIPASYNGKGKLVAWYEAYKAIVDSVGICYFNAGWYELALADLGYFTELYNAMTGMDISKEEMRKTGEKILNLEKAINTVYAGFTRENDYFPKRIMEIPVSGGTYKGEIIHRDKFDEMLDEYYAAHGWDTKTGLQKADTLRSLGLDEVVEFLSGQSMS